jgi:hypothetical protein
MNTRAWSLATGVLSVVGALAFLAFAPAADSAMGKDGLGNPTRHAELSNYAGISFYVALAAWVICLVFSQKAPKPYRGRALFWFGLMVPVGAFSGWLLGAVGA